MDDLLKRAEKLPKGARGALLAMTDEFQFCGRATFTAGGAHSLFWKLGGYKNNVAVEMQPMNDGKWKRAAYRLTPIGMDLAASLSARSTAE